MSSRGVVRAALFAAALLSTGASFGLHPEPIGAEAVAAHRGLASVHFDDAPHPCPACLTPGATLAPPPIALPFRDGPGCEDPPDAPSAAPARREGFQLAGRSPPFSA